MAIILQVNDSVIKPFFLSSGVPDDSLVMWKCMPSNVPFGMPESNSSNQMQAQQYQQPQQQMPRVKLTGSGKMPVMDMKSNNIIHQNYSNIPQSMHLTESALCSNHGSNEAGKSQPILLEAGMHPPVTGLPPKSPVYAVVNKVNKRKLEKQTSSNSSEIMSSEPCRGEVEKNMISFAHSQLHDPHIDLPRGCIARENTPSSANANGDTAKNLNNEGQLDGKDDIFSHHNYCNIGPVLGDVVTMSKDYLPPPPPDHLLLINQPQYNEPSQYHQNTFRQGDQFKVSPQTLQSHPIISNQIPHHYENSGDIIKRLNFQENTGPNIQKDNQKHSLASKSSNYVAMNPNQFLNKSSNDLANQEEDMLPQKEVLPLIPFDPTHNITTCGSSRPCHEYEAIDPISQRLREMSESIKQTYGDDRLTLSPNHIGLIPLSQIQNHSEDSYNINVKHEGDLNVKSQVLSHDISSEMNENASDTSKRSDHCDISANEEAAKPTDSSNIDKKSKNTEKNKHFQCENQGHSVTIPRAQKSQTRKQSNLNPSNASDALSRSYQHPNSLQFSKDNHNSSYQRSGVSMRRSSSVPCKRITAERGSTSSSDDSGFSPGSPNTSALLTGFSLEQAVQNMHLNHNNSKQSNQVPNHEAQENEENNDASNVPSTSS